MDERMGSGEPPSSMSLSDPFEKMKLVSQSQPMPSYQLKMPVPLFNQNNDQNAFPRDGHDVPVSQLDYLATPDFITPGEAQFGLEYDPDNQQAKLQRSPAQLSPNRAKRARATDNAGDLTASQAALRGASQGVLGRPMHISVPGAPGMVRPLVQRCKSPLTYRSVFKDTDNEQEQFADWKAVRPPNPGFSRFKNEFKELGVLGNGSFSKVYHARHRLDGCEYAVKRSHNSVASNDEQFTQYMQEVQLMANLPPHPSIVRYYGSWLEPDASDPAHKSKLYIQLEKCEVSLATHAKLSAAFTDKEVLQVLQQVCRALEHLHAHGIAHLDVKPENIFLVHPKDMEDDEDGSKTKYKLGDFGMAARMKSNKMVVFEGDSRFLPKEVMNNDHSNLDKADMFSLGATLFDLLTDGQLPLSGQLYQDLREGKVPLLPHVNPRLMILIKQLMSPNPQDRPSASKVLRSQLFVKPITTGAGPSALASAPQHQQKTLAPSQVALPSSNQNPSASTGSAASNKIRFGGLVLQKSK